MPLDITLPQLNKPKSAKDIVITILASEYPLTAKKVYNKIKKDYGLNISYQAAYKAITELAEQKILIKNGLEYSLNNAWIEDIENFVDKIKKSYSTGVKPNLFGLSEFKQEGETQTYVFDSLEEAEAYRKGLQVAFFSSGKGLIYCGQSSHIRSPLFLSEKSFKVLSLVGSSDSKAFLISRGNSPIDRWCANFYRSKKVQVKLGIKDCIAGIIVMGDKIIQQYIPKQLEEPLDEVYSMSNIESIDVQDIFQKIYRKKAKIKMTITKNEMLAKQIQANILSYFGDNISICDIDNTLSEGFLVCRFAEHLFKKNIFDKNAFEEIQDALKRYTEGKIEYNKVADIILIAYARGLKGEDVKTVRAIGKEFIKTNARLFSFSNELVSMLGKRGKVFAITGSPREVADYLTDVLPFTKVFATEIGIESEKFTGELITNLAVYNTKKKVLNDYLNDENLDLVNSVGIGDSVGDLAILEMVEKPMVINAKKEMLKTAKERGYEIVTPENVLLKIKNYLEKARKPL
jgi:HAD superfamily hydrolase (TIGR01490 family)